MTDRPIERLFREGPRVLHVGLRAFADALRHLGVPVTEIDWRPPGDPGSIERIDRLRAPDGGWIEPIATANRTAWGRLVAAEPRAVGIASARDAVPGLAGRVVLHAGPPIEWKRMCGPMRGAVIGGLLFEGWADTPAAAEQLAASGEIRFAPCHDHAAVGPMAGVLTPSMPVWVVENTAFGNRAFCSLNEGLGAVLRYGAYGPDVIERLRWMRDTLAPVLDEALRGGGFDLRSWIAQALQMGDEGHNRNRAATSLLIRALAPRIVRIERPRSVLARVLEFLHENDHFALNLTMAAAKSALDPAAGIPASSLVTAMARNGVEFGIRVSGTEGRWFTAPASRVDGLYLPGFAAADAALDIGDSTITESAGYGGFAMAAAPAIVQFVGGTPEVALDTTRRMRSITVGEHPAYRIPALGFRGTPTGIDVLRVVSAGVLPAINTGIAHKDPGVGMIGAGLVTPPMAPFAAAAVALADSVRRDDDAKKGDP